MIVYNGAMAIHQISVPDVSRGRALRTIIWDDVAGTVDGDHYDVACLRELIAAPKPVTVGDPGGTWDLSDPAHDPGEFLILLSMIYWPVMDEPLRSTLPAVFDDARVPRRQPGERLSHTGPGGA